MGALSGDLGFEEDYYNNNKATAVVRKIDTTVKLLHDRSCAAAHSLLYSYLQHQWSYLLRTCRGDNSILLATSKVDEALNRGLATHCSPNVFSDQLLARQMRLPVRMNGFGIRSQTSLLAPA